MATAAVDQVCPLCGGRFEPGDFLAAPAETPPYRHWGCAVDALARGDDGG